MQQTCIPAVAGTDQDEAHQYSSDRWLICIQLSWSAVYLVCFLEMPPLAPAKL